MRQSTIVSRPQLSVDQVVAHIGAHNYVWHPADEWLNVHLNHRVEPVPARGVELFPVPVRTSVETLTIDLRRFCLRLMRDGLDRSIVLQALRQVLADLRPRAAQP
jgi:hypothetical protein